MMPVEMTTNIDFGAMLNGITSATQRSAEEYAPVLLEAVRALWSGFSSGTGASQAAWVVTVTGDAIVLSNTLGYTAYVHKVGERQPYIEQVFDDLASSVGEDFQRDLTAALSGVLNG